MSKFRKYSPPLITKTEETLSLPGSGLIDLLRAVVGKGAQFRFKAGGFSMSPFIKDGDVVTVSPLPNGPLRPGDVAAFVHPKSRKLVVHRLVGKRDSSYLIKGDNTHEGYEIIERSNLLGCVTKVEREGQKVRLGLGPEKFLIAFLTRTELLYPLMSPVWRLVRHVFRMQSRSNT